MTVAELQAWDHLRTGAPSTSGTSGTPLHPHRPGCPDRGASRPRPGTPWPGAAEIPGTTATGDLLPLGTARRPACDAAIIPAVPASPSQPSTSAAPPAWSPPQLAAPLAARPTVHLSAATSPPTGPTPTTSTTGLTAEPPH